jgi:hypothetical protein
MQPLLEMVLLLVHSYTSLLYITMVLCMVLAAIRNSMERLLSSQCRSISVHPSLSTKVTLQTTRQLVLIPRPLLSSISKMLRP